MSTKPVNRHLLHIGILVVVFVVAMIAAASVIQSGYRINITPSLDETIVRVESPLFAKRGDLVEFCRPLPLGKLPPGPCPDGTAKLVKHVIAVEGDVVRYMPDKIVVYPHDAVGEAAEYDAPARPGMPHPTWGVDVVLQAGELVVYAPHPFSFDSRYYGAIARSDRQLFNDGFDWHIGWK